MAILGVGFIITLPFLLLSTPDEKQRLTQSTTTMRVLEHHVGLLDITPDERKYLKSMINKPSLDEDSSGKREVWVSQISPKIMTYERSEHDAKTIAHWVWTYTQQQRLNPALVLALITIESRFDPFATSSVGARGLMQIMPFWTKELGNEQDNLYDVATNIRYGCAILKHYIDRYHSERQALAAYNGSLGKDKYPDKVMSQLGQFKMIHPDVDHQQDKQL